MLESDETTLFIGKQTPKHVKVGT